LPELELTATVCSNACLMNEKNLIAKAEVTINASPEQVWEALTNPVLLKEYMFGSTIISDWKEGSKISWKGEWKGNPYEDKGEVLAAVPGKKLQYSHFSPMTGLEDKAENYHIVTIDLDEKEGHTEVRLQQDKNRSEEERQHSQENWTMMLSGLKKVAERT
jgi:uncharacterized protein YndB with AHSA1/START domain